VITGKPAFGPFKTPWELPAAVPVLLVLAYQKLPSGLEAIVTVAFVSCPNWLVGVEGNK